MTYYQDGKIKDVNAENLTDELRIISDLLEDYNFISMDTEFPGIVFPLNQNSQFTSRNIQPYLINPNLNPTIKGDKQNTPSIDSNYKNIKYNVDNLKLIQIGITLANEFGEFPEEISTWQFNFRFDLDRDAHLTESINLLELAGINFKDFNENGIEMDYFGEVLTTSGIVLNDNLKWITFHGSYDFAYLIKVLSNQNLPDEEQQFNELLGLYFPNFYDVRLMIKNFTWLKGSLSKISTDLEIPRIGNSHQAGSDSLVTSKVFFKLLNNLDMFGDRNKLFGFNYKMVDDYDIYNAYNGNYNTYNQMHSYMMQSANQMNAPLGQSNKATNKTNQTNIPPVFCFQNINGFNSYTNGTPNIPIQNGLNPMYYNGFNHLYPQHMDYNYYNNFYGSQTVPSTNPTQKFNSTGSYTPGNK